MDFSQVRLGIAIPHRNGECHICIARTLTSADIRGIQAVILDNSNPLISENRNILVQQFLDHPFNGTHLFFLDTDVSVPSDGIKTLLAADKPVIAGVYVDKKHLRFVVRRCINQFKYVYVQPEWSKYADGKGPHWIIKEELQNKVIDCDAAGAGCLLIKREVLETMPYPWFYENYKPGATRHEKESSVSEDLTFFYNAKQAGFQGYIHTGVLCDHWMGTHKFPPFWTEEEARRQSTAENP